MTPDLARDDPHFDSHVKVWRRYLVDWCYMPEEQFEAFVDNMGSYSAGVVFHEEDWYHVFNYLTDPCNSPLPFPDAPSDFFRWEWFNYQCLHRAIYRDVDFDDTTDDDGEWEDARQRAVTELRKHGFRLRDYSNQESV